MTNLVIEDKGTPATTSRIIAREFNINHRDLLRTIRITIEGVNDEKFTMRNFALRDFGTVKGNIYQEYVISENGAMLLIMGFTGQKALSIKVQFINAFNAMKSELEKGKHSLDWRTNREAGKIERLSLTDTIKDFVEYATSQGSKSAKMYYMNITKMEYKALELIEKADKQIGGSFRDTLSCTELGHLITAESIARGAIDKGIAQKMHYKDIYQLAKHEVESFANLVNCYKLSYRQTKKNLN